MLHFFKKGSLVAFHDTGWAEGVKKSDTGRGCRKSYFIEKIAQSQEVYKVV